MTTLYEWANRNRNAAMFTTIRKGDSWFERETWCATTMTKT